MVQMLCSNAAGEHHSEVDACSKYEDFSICSSAEIKYQHFWTHSSGEPSLKTLPVLSQL